jgi:hypothetical protein
MAKEMKNLGRLDRVIRMVIAVMLAIVVLSNVMGGWGNIILFVLVAILGYTSLTSTCPIYKILGKSTFKKKS